MTKSPYGAAGCEPSSSAIGPDYDDLLGTVRACFATSATGPLFTTDVSRDALWEAYLSAVDDRQTHTCSACLHFVRSFGGLVTIDEHGQTESAMWHGISLPYRRATRAMWKLVGRAKVNGVFLSEGATLGQPVTGKWTHLSVDLPVDRLYRRTTLTARQRMAELREDFRTISRAVVDFDVSVVEQALVLLRRESLYRGEKVLGAAEWLAKLHAPAAREHAQVDPGVSEIEAAVDHIMARRNLRWLAVATAPPGFCHPRTTMIGTLLTDIADGLSFESASRRFSEKMSPNQYQRPQAAPSEGNIAQAEKIVRQLHARKAFDRRFCHVDEVDALWTPTPTVVDESGPTGGLFAGVEPKSRRKGPRKREGAPMQPPASDVTWQRFRSEILPTADRIEFYAAQGAYNYATLVTASDPDSPPILQWDTGGWDTGDRRNPVSLYVYQHGSTSASFSLDPGKFHDVSAVTFRPSMWYGGEDRFAHHGKGVIFVVSGAYDQRGDGAGAGIFPECLRSEFRPVRATIEAFSSAATLEDAGGPYATGLLLEKGKTVLRGARFRVTSGPSVAEYSLDRWE